MTPDVIVNPLPKTPTERGAGRSPRPGTVTLDDVAKRLGVGRTTVSDILNRSDHGKRYSHATQQRVLRAVQKLGYTPNRGAQALVRGRSGSIGLVLTRTLANPYWVKVAEAAMRELRPHGYRAHWVVATLDEVEGAIRHLHSDHVEGLLVGPVYAADELPPAEVMREGCPAVFFGGFVTANVDVVATDHAAGVRAAVEHLRTMGHRRIAYLGAPLSRLTGRPSTSHSSYRVFKSLRIHHDDWFLWHGDTGDLGAVHAMCAGFARRLRDEPAATRPTAALCHNDRVAMAALAALREHGLRVPDDVSLVGFDNLPESAFLDPPLTSVDLDAATQMRLAVDRLLARIRLPDAPREPAVVQPRLVVRESVRDLKAAASPAPPSLVGEAL